MKEKEKKIQKRFEVVDIRTVVGGHFECLIKDSEGKYAEGGKYIPAIDLAFA